MSDLNSFHAASSAFCASATFFAAAAFFLSSAAFTAAFFFRSAAFLAAFLAASFALAARLASFSFLAFSSFLVSFLTGLGLAGFSPGSGGFFGPDFFFGGSSPSASLLRPSDSRSSAFGSLALPPFGLAAGAAAVRMRLHRSTLR